MICLRSRAACPVRSTVAMSRRATRTPTRYRPIESGGCPLASTPENRVGSPFSGDPNNAVGGRQPSGERTSAPIGGSKHPHRLGGLRGPRTASLSRIAVGEAVTCLVGETCWSNAVAEPGANGFRRISRIPESTEQTTPGFSTSPVGGRFNSCCLPSPTPTIARPCSRRVLSIPAGSQLESDRKSNIYIVQTISFQFF